MAPKYGANWFQEQDRGPYLPCKHHMVKNHRRNGAPTKISMADPFKKTLICIGSPRIPEKTPATHASVRRVHLFDERHQTDQRVRCCACVYLRCHNVIRVFSCLFTAHNAQAITLRKDIHTSYGLQLNKPNFPAMGSMARLSRRARRPKHARRLVPKFHIWPTSSRQPKIALHSRQSSLDS